MYKINVKKIILLFIIFRYNNENGTFTVPPGGDGFYYFSLYLTTYSSKFVYFDVAVSGERLCTAFTDLNVMSSGDRVGVSCSGVSELIEGNRFFNCRGKFERG